jgi:SAM-dependent methyltransferase
MARVVPNVSCVAGHAFDVARQGYASFAVGRGVHGDTADMVAARDRFLSAGHYAPVADAVSAAIPATARGVCVDVGGGTGYYLGAVLDDHEDLVGLVLDTSKPALRRAARSHPRVAAAAADVWAGLPLRSGGVAAVLSIFAPRNPAETARVLAPGGLLVVVTPTDGHLAELMAAVGLVSVDARKRERLERQLEGFEPLAERVVEYRVSLTRREAVDDVLMGPNGHHADAETIERALSDLPDPLETTVSVRVTSFRARAQTQAD